MGIETKYTIEENGTLIKRVNGNEAILKELERKEIKSLFEQAEKLKDYKYFKPDNVYQFIEIDNNRIVWGLNTEIDKKISDLYNQLQQLLN